MARDTGRRMHAAAQWHALVGAEDSRDAAWRGERPDAGNLEPHVLRDLVSVLARHTVAADRCWFCLWEGYGLGDERQTSSVVMFAGDDVADQPVWEPGPRVVSAEQVAGPRVELPDREYFLFAGPVAAALELGERPTRDWFIPQSPNLFWPDDRAWCVATEIDFDSTLVGGSAALIRELVEHPGLEVWDIGAGVSLRADGDHING